SGWEKLSTSEKLDRLDRCRTSIDSWIKTNTIPYQITLHWGRRSFRTLIYPNEFHARTMDPPLADLVFAFRAMDSYGVKVSPPNSELHDRALTVGKMCTTPKTSETLHASIAPLLRSFRAGMSELEGQAPFDTMHQLRFDDLSRWGTATKIHFTSFISDPA